jgi:hypothetical protein
MQISSTTRSRVTTRRNARRALLVVTIVAMLASIATLFGGVETSRADVITTPPFSLPDKGTLTLTLGATTNNVVQRDSVAHGGVVLATQGLSSVNCALTTTPTLLGFATSKGVPGLNSSTHEIGDKTKGTGTDCGLTEAGGSLTLNMGSATSTLEISHFALDIETRKNVKVILTAKLNGTVTSTHELRSGTSIVAGQGSSTVGATPFNCNSQSSSNPNSGDNDNCRWEGDVLANQLVLTAPIGEFALAGGSDGGRSQPSVLSLTDVIGLDCQTGGSGGQYSATTGDGITAPEVGLIRKDNLDPNEPCQVIPAELISSSNGGLNQLEFLKDLNHQQSGAFTMDVTWPNEGAQNPPPPTQIDFGSGALDLDLCLGTPVYTPPLGSPGAQFQGIAELTDGDFSPSDVATFDLVPNTPGIQYACYYNQQTQLVAGGTVQLFQQLYLVGDFRATR